MRTATTDKECLVSCACGMGCCVLCTSSTLTAQRWQLPFLRRCASTKWGDIEGGGEKRLNEKKIFITSNCHGSVGREALSY